MLKRIVFVLFMISVTLMGCRKKEVLYGTPTRPDDFPINIFPPDNAMEVDYASPDTAKVAKGFYSLSYMINEEYPAKETVEAIQEILRSKGYVKVEWAAEDYVVHIFDAVDGKRKDSESKQETEALRKSMNENPRSTSKWKKGDPIEGDVGDSYYSWKDQWITGSDDLVEVIFSYAKKEVNELYVQFYVCTSLSGEFPYVKKYKKLHPEKFEKAD
jgi:hypothetical protein